MARTSNAKKKKIAEDFFVSNYEATQKEIAELVGISEKTIGIWVKEGEWVRKRDDYHSSPVKIKELLQRELLSVAQGNPPKLNADNISKLVSGIERLDKTVNPYVVQNVLKDLDNFISEIDPQFAIRGTELHKQFLIHRINME